VTESLRDRLIRVAKAVPFRYTDIVDAILRELGAPLVELLDGGTREIANRVAITAIENVRTREGADAATAFGTIVDAIDAALRAVAVAAHDKARAEHAELLAALEWLAREPCAAVARHYVAHLGDPMPHDGTGPSIAAALVRAHKEST
jgi:hypothetical protein